MLAVLGSAAAAQTPFWQKPQQPAQPMNDEQATSMRLNILKDLIDNEIIMQHAEKLGLLATDDEVEQKLNEIKSPYSADDFKKLLVALTTAQ